MIRNILMSDNVLLSYIGVDIFGSKYCSNLRCSSKDNGKCLQMMNMTYKVINILVWMLCRKSPR